MFGVANGMDKEFEKMTNLIIRPEQTEDFHNTELMTMRSFWNKYFPGCVEHNMLRVIRVSCLSQGKSW